MMFSEIQKTLGFSESDYKEDVKDLEKFLYCGRGGINSRTFHQIKYLYEEKMWFLAKTQLDYKCFDLMNFNQIVKKTLLDHIMDK
jgi:hypothetical protein